MKRAQITIFVLVAVVLVAGLLISQLLKDRNDDPDSTDYLKEKCESVNGVWQEFPNGCVDSCDWQRNPAAVSCIQALTFGCECPNDNQCWNGNSCEDI